MLRCCTVRDVNKRCSHDLLTEYMALVWFAMFVNEYNTEFKIREVQKIEQF